MCEATGEPVTVVNLDGYKGRRLLGELNFPEGKLRLIEKWKTYPDYLRDVARHKIVLQLDRSHVPGQVAGDALLCRIPCVGGDGAIERIAFSKTCGEGRTINEIASMALDLLKNPELREAVVAESQERARERLSFEAVRSQLAKFFANVQGTSALVRRKTARRCSELPGVRRRRTPLQENQKMISKSLMPFHFPGWLGSNDVFSTQIP